MGTRSTFPAWGTVPGTEAGGSQPVCHGPWGLGGITTFTDMLPSFDVIVIEDKTFFGDIYQIVEVGGHWTHGTISCNYVVGCLEYQMGRGAGRGKRFYSNNTKKQPSDWQYSNFGSKSSPLQERQDKGQGSSFLDLSHFCLLSQFSNHQKTTKAKSTNTEKKLPPTSATMRTGNLTAT